MEYREAIIEAPPVQEKPKEDTSMKCKALTKTGNPCKRLASPKYEGYCTIHGKLNEKAN